MITHLRYLYITIMAFCWIGCIHPQPRLTVIFVIDQFAYHYFTKLQPHFQYGLKTLTDRGIVYKNATIPHGGPATGTGHTGLSTGVFAKDHGIIGNSWINADGISVACDDDRSPRGQILTPNSEEKKGKSAENIMVPGLSDQFVLADAPDHRHYAYSISVKSRAAICTANKLGKAVWIDAQSGLATSSKAYFQQLPAWLTAFNTKNEIATLKKSDWKLMYDPACSAYQFNNICNYQYANARGTLLGKKPRFAHIKKHKKAYELFFATPQANELTFKLAQDCITHHIKPTDSNHLLLWVCISGLDKAGHMFGPESIELVDMIYHLDKQLQDFMQFCQQYMQDNNVLFCLTADHGIEPVTELMQQKGLTNARRIKSADLITKLNALIEEKYGITNIVQSIKQPNVYLRQATLKSLDPSQQHCVLKELKQYLQHVDGIKTVWTYDELHRSVFEPTQLENFFKQQLFPGRSGQLIIQTYPYVIMCDKEYSKGTSHQTPYEYDTHVPLMLYCPGITKPTTITKKVWALQLANTVAQLLDIQKPPASTFEFLPGAVE